MRIPCKKCNRRFKSLTKAEEEGLCLTCYYEKYEKYPISFMGHSPKGGLKK